MISVKAKLVITIGATVAGALLLLSLFLYLLTFIIFPQTEEFVVAEQDTQAVEKKIDDFNIILAPSFEKYNTQITELEKRFFSLSRERDGRDFISILQNTAKNNSVSLDTTTIPTTGLPHASFRISGSLPHMFKFLREIENERFFVTITALSMQREAITVDITLQTL